MTVATIRAYVAVTAAASAVVGTRNRATMATTGMNISHLASQTAAQASDHLNAGRDAASLGPFRMPHQAVRMTRRMPGPMPPRNMCLMLIPALVLVLATTA